MFTEKVCLFLLVVALYGQFTPLRMQSQATGNPEPKPAQQSPPVAPMRGNVEILSDTQGVDFGPYLQRALYRIKMNWYNLIPEVAKPPMSKSGSLIIQFAIMKDGRVQGMILQLRSGDALLDRAAWGGITTSNPFEPLPSVFSGPYLALRIKFIYNQKGEVETTPDSPAHEFKGPFALALPHSPVVSNPSAGPPVSTPEAGSSVAVEVLDRGNFNDDDLKQFLKQNLEPALHQHWKPSVSDRARELETAQTVIVSFSIGRDGAFSSIKLDQSSGNSELDAAAIQCVKLSAPVALPDKSVGGPISVKAKFTYGK